MKAVRCGSNNPTPFLKKNLDLFTECVYETGHVVDIGCGNGRNSEYLRSKGMLVLPLDGKGDYGIKWEAGNIIPTERASADLILCNYFLMFIPDHARNDIYKEIDRVSHKGTRCMIELEQVKQSLCSTEASLHALNDEVQQVMKDMGWTVIKKNKNRYIFEKE